MLNKYGWRQPVFRKSGAKVYEKKETRKIGSHIRTD